MNEDLYELISLAMRYVFMGLMLVIVLRAWRTTAKDSARARKLRAWSPETGLAGELVVLSGGEKAPEGMRYPVIREGVMGSAKKADIRIRHSSVRQRHCYFTLEENGLRVRSDSRAARTLYSGARLRDEVLPDGAVFRVGDVKLLLVLNDASRAVNAARATGDVLSRKWDDELFDTPIPEERRLPQEMEKPEARPPRREAPPRGREPDGPRRRPAQRPAPRRGAPRGEWDGGILGDERRPAKPAERRRPARAEDESNDLFMTDK